MPDGHAAGPAYVELTHRYADAVDRGAGAEVAALFTADGRWDGRAYGLGVVTGADALARHFAGGDGDDRPASVHLVANHLVDEVTDGRAVARSVALAVQPRGDGVRQLVVGYDDVVVVDGDRWLFAERTLRRGPSF